MQQLLFNLANTRGDAATRASTPGRKGGMSNARIKQNMRRAVVCWLQNQDAPLGIATDTVTRVSRFKADLAAFWSRSLRNPQKEGPSRILQPVKTAIFQCYTERDECWAECTHSAGILPRLHDCKERRTALESEIRRQEPELKDTNTLFEEYAQWNYDKTRNRAYHRLQRDIQSLEHALLKGTRFEQIRAAQVADVLYLAVPSGLVSADELADGWGLLWVQPDLTVTLKREAEWRDCLPGNRLHLVQNIAAAASKDMLYARGIRATTEGKYYLTRPPRGHRQPQRLRLERHQPEVH